MNFFSLLKKQSYLENLFLIFSLFFSFFLSDFFLVENFNYGSDDYKEISKSLFDNKAFVREEFFFEIKIYEPVVDRLPLFPLIYGFLMLIFKNENIIFSFNFFLFFLTLKYIFKISRKFFNKNLCFLIVFIISLSLINIKYIQSQNPNVLSMFVITLFVYKSYKIFIEDKKNLKEKLLFIFIIILAVFTRHNNVFLLIPFLFFLFFKNKNFYSLFLIFLVIFFIFTWSYRNYKVANYFNFSSLSLRTIYSTYVLFNKNEEYQRKYFNYLKNLQNKNLEKIANGEKSNFNKKLDYFYLNEIIVYIVDNKLEYLKNLIKSFLAMYIHSSHKTEDIIFSKILNLDKIYSHELNVGNYLRNEKYIIEKFFYYLIKFFCYIIGFLFCFINLFFLMKFKPTSSGKDWFIKSLNFSIILYLLISGFFSGLYYSDRGLLVVYNFEILITFYLVAYYLKKKFYTFNSS